VPPGLILAAVRGCRHMRSVGSKSPAPLLPRRAAAASKPRKIERQSSPSSASSSDDSAATLVDAAAITQQVRAGARPRMPRPVLTLPACLVVLSQAAFWSHAGVFDVFGIFV